MIKLDRFSEPYNATGGLAAVGVLNQLGRPDIEPLEVLVREAVQNCWDAKRDDVNRIQVEIGRSVLGEEQVRTLRDTILVDPPPGLGLDEALEEGTQLLYVADFGTQGLGGPTRADRPGAPRDFVDFIRNIGQPPDKDFGGGSFGYGKAAFYIASSAHTIVVDTLCVLDDGRYERRLLGCALGDNFNIDGSPYTGRHWWGRVLDGVPEPLTGAEADAVAAELGLPHRSGKDGMGTTVLVVSPGIGLQTTEGADCSMQFIADAVVWNFWPRMIDTAGGAKRSIEFRLFDNGAVVRVPDARTHPRLRGFVEAMDRMHQDSGPDDDFMIDRPIKCLSPVRKLGRLTIQKGALAPADLPDRPVPRGAWDTRESLHHVALMRTPEIVVKYLPGAAPLAGKMGYSGVFKCDLDVDDAFKAAEPPTHDDWVHRFVQDPHHRTFVNVAYKRILGICRNAAGFESSVPSPDPSEGVPLGEFADALAVLMPGSDGPGARRSVRTPNQPKRKRRRRAPGRTDIEVATSDVWVDGPDPAQNGVGTTGGDAAVSSVGRTRASAPPQARPGGEPGPAMGADGAPVMRYPFDLRTRGHRVRLLAEVEIMINDGQKPEKDPPAGYVPPRVVRWIDPAGLAHKTVEVLTGPEGGDGRWAVEIELHDEMMRVDVTPQVT
ncbi:hypothetical protein [Mycolicibacterium sediminis]|uniref:Uncharacterized protein n=1 Tax=Mycolicibacterium sediminis TaxID=1286180 RepID=A0A7I7QPA2_9MYCO|nr:hypothetical protein [Mycolicibacterium sediminis]BBY28105.1 hypothetical protein MSEDJ_22010 [Mycolicibacterium sediminis]